MNKILLAFIFYVVAAASFNGFFQNWAALNRDTHIFEDMYEGTVKRPFVYRRLLIEITQKIDNATPENLKAVFVEKMQVPHDKIFPKVNIEEKYIFPYLVICTITFLNFFLALIILRKICFEVTKSKIAATASACIFILIFPLLETVGGFFYDLTELIFFSTAALLAYRGNFWALILIAPIAEYNKESFLFFLATLFPLLAAKIGNKKAFFSTATAIILSGCVYLYLKSLYVENPGGAVEMHLPDHIDFFFENWFYLYPHYGVLFGIQTFLPHILLVAWLIKCTWKKLSAEWKNHLKIAAAINIPLYMLFCWPGELRNLSMLYIGFVIILSIFIKEAIANERKE